MQIDYVNVSFVFLNVGMVLEGNEGPVRREPGSSKPARLLLVDHMPQRILQLRSRIRDPRYHQLGSVRTPVGVRNMAGDIARRSPG